MMITFKLHSAAELHNEAWRTKPRHTSYGEWIQSGLFYLLSGRWFWS